MPDNAVPYPNAHRVQETRIPCYVFDSNTELARHVAQVVASVIRQRSALGDKTVLAFPAGSTPTGFFRELVRMYKAGEVDFSNVIVFNVDEYYRTQSEILQSRARTLREQFFNHVNVPADQIKLLDGRAPREQLGAYCQAYEAEIAQAGGIDIAILGIGRNGHIGGNEPLSASDSRTRTVTIDPVTRKGLASDFFGEANVPTHAITMGLGTILSARQIMLLAMGEHKAQIIRTVVEESASERVPASLLQRHPQASVLVDAAAGKSLTDRVTPWYIGSVEWTDALIKRAVLWLCEKSGKACLKLDDHDFRDHRLEELLRHHGPSERLAKMVFNWMMETIDYHPAGTGNKKRVICFSPHPDDDVISMGGGLIRLNEDGHEVHVAYMTSGNIAVFDHDARRMSDFVTDYNHMFGIECDQATRVASKVYESFARKRAGDPDIEHVLKIKALIRRGEAKFGAFEVGCREEHLHFLDMPFYCTGTIAKREISDEDVAVVRATIEKVQPHQIYLAGDLSDPHGTHRVCADAIFRALKAMERDGLPLPEVLLYRGAWQEYELHEIEIAMPMSPSDLMLKRQAIFMHESQKDNALFPGSDPRQFWQRAEDRNMETARRYNQIGLPEFYAIEAYVRWNGVPI